MQLIKDKIHISGMHCNGCVERVTKVLNNINGVRSAEVSLDGEQAEVVFDEDQTGFTEMKNAIENAGYEAWSINDK